VCAPRESSGGPRLLQLAAFFSSFDRFVVAPMLVTIADSLQVSLTEVAATASLYYLLYGLMQPVWGMVSDRLGRVRVMRLSLFGVAVAGVLSALAPNLTVLIAARAFAGGLFAAVIPASLVYIGDTVGMGSRQKALADLMAASAMGTALATVLGGLLQTSTAGGSPSQLLPSLVLRLPSCLPDCRSRRLSPSISERGDWSSPAVSSFSLGP
jgi:MFS family permease